MAYKPNKATKEDFNKHLIPNDNSYCTNLKTGKEGELVGLKVKIISIPFTMEVKIEGKNSRMKEREFVLVQYKRQTYRVFNDFRK